MNKEQMDALLTRIQTTGVTGPGNARVRAIVARLLRDLMYSIEDLDVQPEEFWAGLSFLAKAGAVGELGLIAPALGLEHFLDVRMDEAESRAGIAGGTPRTIEGPLYVAGAPVCQGEARLDDGSVEGQVVMMRGVVRGARGAPLADARVEVWHANHLGNYSYFDKTQSAFNLRRTIVTDVQGRYRFRSIMPLGYSTPPGGATEQLLQALGRHGHRPAHIHFFVAAQGHRKLTTQINIASDPRLWDDFAFGTREGLVPQLKKNDDPAAMRALATSRPFYEIDFDFALNAADDRAPACEVRRERAAA